MRNFIKFRTAAKAAAGPEGRGPALALPEMITSKAGDEDAETPAYLADETMLTEREPMSVRDLVSDKKTVNVET